MNDMIPNTFDALLARVDDENKHLRVAVFNELGVLGDVRAIPPLLDCLGDDSGYIRDRAARALSMFGEPAVAPLIGWLNDEHWLTRSKVGEALERIGTLKALAALEARRADPDNFDPAAFLADWKQTDGAAYLANSLTALLTRLAEGDMHSQDRAVSALGKLGDRRAVGPLLERLEKTGQQTRVRVIEALGKIGDEAAIPALRACLDDEDRPVRIVAADALSSIGDPHVQSVVPELITYLTDIMRAFVTGVIIHNLAAKTLTHIGTPLALAAVEVWEVDKGNFDPAAFLAAWEREHGPYDKKSGTPHDG